jgi:ABC-type amino acid transport substrate-binding protein
MKPNHFFSCSNLPLAGTTLPRMLFCLAAIGVFGVSLTAAACTKPEDRWEEIVASGVLRIGLDPTYPPFEVADGDMVYGLDVDLARALAAEVGLTPQFHYFGYDGLYDALTTGQVDVLISALIIAPERTRDVAYTPPYFDAGQYLVTPAESTVTSMADLAGRSLAVELGALGHVAALEWQRRQPDMVIIPFNTAGSALESVGSNEVDAALVDHVSALLHLREDSSPENPPLRIAPEPVSPEPYAIAVRIGDRTLLQKLSVALEKVRENGQLEKITRSWLGN